MDRPPRYSPEPTSAPGDFYVEKGCCTSCGVPQVAAPDLVGWNDDKAMDHCRWKKQPSTQEELQQAFAIFDGQELGCHRYAGVDAAIQERIGIENCDYTLDSSGQVVASPPQTLPVRILPGMSFGSKKLGKWRKLEKWRRRR